MQWDAQDVVLGVLRVLGPAARAVSASELFGFFDGRVLVPSLVVDAL